MKSGHFKTGKRKKPDAIMLSPNDQKMKRTKLNRFVKQSSLFDWFLILGTIRGLKTGRDQSVEKQTSPDFRHPL